MRGIGKSAVAPMVGKQVVGNIVILAFPRGLPASAVRAVLGNAGNAPHERHAVVGRLAGVGADLAQPEGDARHVAARMVDKIGGQVVFCFRELDLYLGFIGEPLVGPEPELL